MQRGTRTRMRSIHSLSISVPLCGTCCSMWHGVYEFRRGFCTSVLSFSSGGGEVGRALYSDGEGPLSRCSGLPISLYYTDREHMIKFSSAIQDAINPRRACAARVTVLALCVCLSVCLCVCVSVCYRSSSYSVRFNLQPTASAALL